uniref:(northern house mosquito) hypothetical protein n=1 Tax=Culex pipiens TaxID=7175 RepID=A0A8D8N4J3_CULPI
MHTLFEPIWPARHLQFREGSQKKSKCPHLHPRHCAPSRKNVTQKHVAHAAFGAGPTSRTKRRNPSRPQVHPYPGRVRCARSFKRGRGKFALTTATQRGVAIKAGFVWLLVFFFLNTCFSGGARMTLDLKVGRRSSTATFLTKCCLISFLTVVEGNGRVLK